MSNRPDGGAVVARLNVDEGAARRLLLAGADGLEEATIAAFEAGGRWVVEVSSVTAPAGPDLGAWVARAAVPQTAMTRVCEPVVDRDWVAGSLAGLGPVEAGRFVVHGRHDRARTRKNQVAIEVEAAGAFGSGHHGTTRGCLLALDGILKGRRPACVLDLGTGTGVLAIAAAKALRVPVAAIDIDPQAVGIARANAARNGVPGLVAVVCGAGLRAARPRGPFDLVLANLLLGPLQGLAVPIARRLGPSGRAVLSGLLSHQAPAALAAYRRCGLALERRILLDGWTTLVLVRSSSGRSRDRTTRPLFDAARRPRIG
jgi:ribosomal protein L11 methyltransferase